MERLKNFVETGTDPQFRDLDKQYVAWQRQNPQAKVVTKTTAIALGKNLAGMDTMTYVLTVFYEDKQ